MQGTKQYSVILLFNKDGSKVLLQKKDRTTYKGMLNGIGGKVEDGEDPFDGALRELMEETTIKKEDLSVFRWLGRLILPIQCDEENMDKIPDLWFYTGIVKEETSARKAENETEKLEWYVLSGNMPVTGIPLAGDGNLEYFISIAKKLLFNSQMPG